jgi:hypothetical protein
MRPCILRPAHPDWNAVNERAGVRVEHDHLLRARSDVQVAVTAGGRQGQHKASYRRRWLSREEKERKRI